MDRLLLLFYVLLGEFKWINQVLFPPKSLEYHRFKFI